MGKVIVFGSINIDLVASIDQMPRPGETIIGNSFDILPGGKGANQALAARRAGAETVMAGAVGTDVFAEPALENLRAAGVDLSRVRTVEGPGGIASIMVDGNGENVIAIIAGANGSLNGPEGAAIEIAAGDSLLLQMEVPAGGSLAAVRRAKEAGATVILNAAPMIPDVMDLVPHVSILIVNETELASVCRFADIDADDDREKTRLLARHYGISVVTTLGADGIFAVHDGKELGAEAFPVNVVDTVGAGDTVCGTIAARIANGDPLSKDVLELAAVAGSLACTKPGAQASIPLLDDVLKARRAMV